MATEEEWVGFRLLVDTPLWPVGIILEGVAVIPISGGLKAFACRVINSDDCLFYALPRELEPLTSAAVFFLTLEPEPAKRSSKKQAVPPRARSKAQRDEMNRKVQEATRVTR